MILKLMIYIFKIKSNILKIMIILKSYYTYFNWYNNIFVYQFF